VKYSTKQITNSPILKYAIIGVILYILYKIVKIFNDPFGTKLEGEELSEDIKVDLSNLTYPKYWYTASANSIENAILSELSEDESVVDGIMWQIHNDDDIAQLMESFGVRQMVYVGFIPSENFNLISAIQTYMPERINDYNSHFEGWNMKFRF